MLPIIETLAWPFAAVVIAGCVLRQIKPVVRAWSESKRIENELRRATMSETIAAERAELARRQAEDEAVAAASDTLHQATRAAAPQYVAATQALTVSVLAIQRLTPLWLKAYRQNSISWPDWLYALDERRLLPDKIAIDAVAQPQRRRPR